MTLYKVTEVHKIAGRLDKESRTVELQLPSTPTDRRAMGKLLREARVLSAGQAIQEIRLTHGGVGCWLGFVVFPTRGVTHSFIFEAIQSQPKFNESDIGCIADGGFGHDHIRTRLAELCEFYGEEELPALLRAEMSDDAGEENEAIDWLNEHACEGVYLTLEAGDLMLLADDNNSDD